MATVSVAETTKSPVVCRRQDTHKSSQQTVTKATGQGVERSPKPRHTHPKQQIGGATSMRCYATTLAIRPMERDKVHAGLPPRLPRLHSRSARSPHALATRCTRHPSSLVLAHYPSVYASNSPPNGVAAIFMQSVVILIDHSTNSGLVCSQQSEYGGVIIRRSTQYCVQYRSKDASRPAPSSTATIPLRRTLLKP